MRRSCRAKLAQGKDGLARCRALNVEGKIHDKQAAKCPPRHLPSVRASVEVHNKVRLVISARSIDANNGHTGFDPVPRWSHHPTYTRRSPLAGSKKHHRMCKGVTVRFYFRISSAVLAEQSALISRPLWRHQSYISTGISRLPSSVSPGGACMRWYITPQDIMSVPSSLPSSVGWKSTLLPGAR